MSIVLRPLPCIIEPLEKGTPEVTRAFESVQRNFETLFQDTKLIQDEFDAVIPIVRGGTNITTYTTGDTLYASATNVLSKLAIGTVGKFYRSDGTIPAWSTSTISDTFAAGSIVHASASNTLTALAVGSAGQVLRSTGTLPAWSTFTIPNTFALADIIYASATNVLTALPANASNSRYLSNQGVGNIPSWIQVKLGDGVSGILPVANGGTSFATYTTGDILQASGVGNLAKLVAVATGNAIISGGVGVISSWGKIGLTTHVSGTLPVANGGTNAAAFTLGSVVFAGASGTYTQDNANLFWDDTNNRLGIGNAAPSSKLDITTAGLGTTQTTSSGLALVNTTAAAAGAQQISPAIRWSGFGWKTNATAASQSVDFRCHVVPRQGTAAPDGYLAFSASVNGAAYSDNGVIINSGGALGVGIYPTVGLDVIKGGVFRLGSSVTDVTIKEAKVVCPHYTAAEKNIMVLYGYSTSAVSEMWFGGGSASENALTGIVFATGATITTPTGTERMRITSTGNLEVSGTTGALVVSRLTTAQRDALTAVNGMIIYNTTTNTMQGRVAAAWVNL